MAVLEPAVMLTTTSWRPRLKPVAAHRCQCLRLVSFTTSEFASTPSTVQRRELFVVAGITFDCPSIERDVPSSVVSSVKPVKEFSTDLQMRRQSHPLTLYHGRFVWRRFRYTEKPFLGRCSCLSTMLRSTPRWRNGRQ